MIQLMKKLESVLQLGGTKRDIVFLVISGAALLCSIFHLVSLPFDIAWIAIILCGIPIALEAIIGLVTKFDIKADVLVALALIASIFIGEYFAAGEVAFIMQLGALLEDLTVAKARAGLEKLVHLTPQTARRIKNGQENIIAAKEVEIGDILRLIPGETIPVDGVIISGTTSINQAVMTGESLPVDKSVGDEVSSGTVNQFGTFEMKAVKVGEDSSIQRMIRLVQSADAGKAKIVGIADRWATWIVVIALTAAALTWIVTGEIIRAVTILVVFCPCALVLATPTAIMAAIGNATKHGFLVRQGDALERLSSVKHVVFDKTGTLTFGSPKVIAVKTANSVIKKDELYKYAAAVEKCSEHPLGKAVVKSYLEASGEAIPEVSDFKMEPGKGVTASVDGKRVLAGNIALLLENGIIIDKNLKEDAEEYLQKGSTVIYIAFDAVPVGFIALSDTIRPLSIEMIDEIKRIGIKPILLTGDNKNAARTIATKLHIEDVKADCLPLDKLNTISEYQNNNEPVCMIGDGINDAPALKQSDVGVAMGGIGSDIAVEAADIALVDDKLGEIPHLLALSKKMMTTIKLNLSFSMLLNFVAIALAITGILNPVIGALVHNAGSVLVIINSALLLKWRKRELYRANYKIKQQKQIEKFLIQEFGTQKGMELFEKETEILAKIIDNTNGKTSNQMKTLMQVILPRIALYKAFSSCGYSIESTYKYIRKYMIEVIANKKHKSTAAMEKVPFFFYIYRFSFLKIMRSTDLQLSTQKSGKGFYDITISKCLWHTACVENNCSELCKLFCDVDDVTYGGLKKIGFSRTQTLGYGGSCCDFHFFKK